MKMKRKIAAAVVAALTAVSAAAQTDDAVFTTGSEVKYYPVGVEPISFKGNTPLPVVSEISKINDSVFKLSLTAVLLSNTTADGTYPVTVTYYLKTGDIIEFRRTVEYIGSAVKKFKVKETDWNRCVFTAVESEKAPAEIKPSEDVL